MRHNTYCWKTKDNKSLFAQCWKPDKESKKTILMIHGLGEHSGRYDRWARMFVEKGYNFLSFDLRGHGRSSGQRAYAKSLEVLLSDIDLLFSKAKKMFKDNKLVLYGHSMGGSLVLNHIIIRNHPVDALIVSSPWLKMEKEPPGPLLAIASFASKFCPRITLNSRLDLNNRSHDPEVEREFQKDPLNFKKISFRLFNVMYNAGYHALRNVYKINYPFLLMHGTEDKITSHRASENYVMNTSERTRLKLWEGQYHELHNELIYKEIFEYIIDWLKSHKIE
ncbi:MAG: alpha/beta hydrolase [Bacteroidota bacterium]